MKAVLVLSVLAAIPALAQPQPFFYLSAEPYGHSLGSLAGQASVIVRAFADLNDPEQTALDIIAEYDQLHGYGEITSGHYAVWLQNFGQPNMASGGGGATHSASFFADGDKWGQDHNHADVSWDGDAPASTDPLWYTQPWLKNGIPQAQTWMNDFITAFLNNNASRPMPDFFSFDNEIALATTPRAAQGSTWFSSWASRSRASSSTARRRGPTSTTPAR